MTNRAAPIEWADAIRTAQANALRDVADYFEGEMASVWGRGATWVTTGTHVAELVADVLREHASDLQPNPVSDDRDAREAHLRGEDRGCPGCECGEHQWLDRPESDTRECLICGTEVAG